MFACTGTRASNSLALFGAFIPGKRLNFNTSADIFSIIPLKNVARWNQKSSATLLVEPKELYPQKHSANETPYPFNKWYPSATLDTKTSILVESSHHQICHSFLQFQYKRHVYAVFVWFLLWNNKRQKQKKNEFVTPILENVSTAQVTCVNSEFKQSWKTLNSPNKKNKSGYTNACKVECNGQSHASISSKTFHKYAIFLIDSQPTRKKQWISSIRAKHRT